MHKKSKRRMIRLFIIGFIIYGMIGLLFYLLQELILFHPRSLPQQHTFRFPQPFTEVNVKVDGDRNLHLVQFTVPDSLQKGIVLFFHGNRRNIERYADYAPYFTENGYEVWMPDYPGFGKSTGRRTEQRMYEDALRIYDLAAGKVTADRIIIYGKSIGTGVAAYLASVRNSQQLILETPYYSIQALVRHFLPMYPTQSMIHYHFPTYQYLKKVESPVTILHGTSDEIIPYRQAKQLQKEHPQIKLVTIEGGKHNNLLQYPSFQQALDSLLSP